MNKEQNKYQERQTPHYAEKNGPAYYSSGYGVPEYSGGPDEEGGIDLLRLFFVLLRMWWVLVIFVLIAGAVAVTYLKNATKIYQSSSQIEMSIGAMRSIGNEGALLNDAEVDNTGKASKREVLFKTRAESFRSSMLIDKALEYMQEALRVSGDDRNFTLSFDPNSGADLVANISMVKNSLLLRFTVTGASPEGCAAAANGLAKAAVWMTHEENKSAIRNAVKSIEETADSFRRKWEAAGEEMVAYKTKNNAGLLKNDREKLRNQQTAFGDILIGMERNRVLTVDLIEIMKGMQEQPESVMTIPEEMPKQEYIQGLLDVWRTHIQEKQQLMTRYTDQHPEVLEKNEQINLDRHAVVVAYADVKKAAQAKLNFIDKQMSSMREKLAGVEQLQRVNEQKMVELSGEIEALEWKRDLASQAYKSEQVRMERARLSADSSTASVKVVGDLRRPPQSPIKPRFLVVLAMAVFLGGALGAGFVLLLDFLRDRVQGAADVQQAVRGNLLAMIPELGKKERIDVATVALNNPFHRMVEVFAGLRVKLESTFEHSDDCCVTMITSSGAGEGKSISATNLSISLAQAGKKTLLIDLDLRRPRIATVFGIDKKVPSLLDALNENRTDYDNLTTAAAGCPGLSLITSRASKKLSPAAIVAGKQLLELLEWARQNFDRVVIDTPPYGLVADAGAVAHAADAIVLVCRVGQTHKKQAAHVIRQFHEHHLPIQGVVLNAVRKTKSSYYYNYGHYTHGYEEYHSKD